LKEVANELSNRLIKLWLRNEKGERPFLRASAGAFNPETDSELCWFHEYFNGNDGGGLGSSHQTGWTALVADLLLDPPRRVRRLVFYDDASIAPDLTDVAAGPAG
jgi:hypothetical protein